MINKTRHYLRPEEVEQLLKAVKRNPFALRDTTLILLIYRHGLRISEALALQWGNVDFQNQTLHVYRSKNGIDSVQPMTDKEIELLKQLLKHPPQSSFLFVNEKSDPLPRRSAYHIIHKAGEKAKLSLKVSPHMLRHSCGYYLANRNVATRTIQEYMGHKNIQNTVKYTALAPQRFHGLWGD